MAKLAIAGVAAECDLLAAGRIAGNPRKRLIDTVGVNAVVDERRRSGQCTCGGANKKRRPHKIDYAHAGRIHDKNQEAYVTRFVEGWARIRVNEQPAAEYAWRNDGFCTAAATAKIYSTLMPVAGMILPQRA